MSVVGRREIWSRLNHLFAGRKDLEGYAVCANCGHAENTNEAAKPCLHGPATKQVIDELITLTAGYMKLEAQLAEALTTETPEPDAPEKREGCQHIHCREADAARTPEEDE